MSFKKLLDETDKTARETLGEYYIVSKSRMDNYLSCLESGSQRIRSLEDENFSLRSKVSELMREDLTKENLPF